MVTSVVDGAANDVLEIGWMIGNDVDALEGVVYVASYVPKLRHLMVMYHHWLAQKKHHRIYRCRYCYHQ